MQQMHEGGNNKQNKMIDLGRLCVKIAGRDAGKKFLVVDTIDSNFVLVDGEGRRKRCNIDHLEPLDKKIEIAKGIGHEEVLNIFKELNIPVNKGLARPRKERQAKKREVENKLKAKEKKNEGSKGKKRE